MKRSAVLFLILLALGLSACGRIRDLVAETPTPQPTATLEIITPQPTATPYLPVHPANMHPDCPATDMVSAQPPSIEAAQFPAVGWYQSKDGQLWAASSGDGTVYSGETSFAWSKPAGARLIVSAKRIDGQSAPFLASIPENASGDYQLAKMIFPSRGCWSVQAQAGPSTLEFILYVEPTAYPPQGGECKTVDDAARLADAILIAKVTHTDLSKDYAWQTIQVLDVWKNPFQRAFDPSIELLQTLSQEPPLETGKTYLLFLQYTPWQIVCASQTLAEESDQALSLLSGMEPLWKGTTLAEIQTEVYSILKP